MLTGLSEFVNPVEQAEGFTDGDADDGSGVFDGEAATEKAGQVAALGWDGCALFGAGVVQDTHGQGAGQAGRVDVAAAVKVGGREGGAVWGCWWARHGSEEGPGFEEPSGLFEAIEDEGDPDGKAEPEDEGGGEEVGCAVMGQEFEEAREEGREGSFWLGIDHSARSFLSGGSSE